MTALNPIQKYLLRLVLFDAGKTILYKGAICEVTETHKQIRRLLPLINESMSESKVGPFWVPRRPSDRLRFNVERMKNSRRHRTLSAPMWTGESRPNGTPVALQTLTANSDSSGTLASTWGKHIPSHLLGNWLGFHLVPVAKSDPMKTQTFFSRKSVERALQKMRTDCVKKTALMEVVFYRQSPTAVARTYVFPLPNLEVYASRLRTRIRSENPDAFAN